jgi:class III poly(R)-hydroxyalkanoic acid synthase PhaE subunit
MATSTSQGSDFEALARQYWTAWGDAVRGAAIPTGHGAGPQAAMQAGIKAWHDGIDWWTRQVHGNRSEVNDVVERFNSQARAWYGQMQQVAAQFAGQDAGAGEVARAWKQALGAVGENPFPEMFRAMRGQGQQGLDQWIEDASPYLDAWKRESASWLGMPAFGFARERQERQQALMQALLDYQDKTSAYNALMMKSAQRAYEVFEDKLVERAEPGRQLQSARAMFDLWIDAAEEAYTEIALSPEFRKVYGDLVDAQMRVRAGMQKEVEQMSEKLGMPTRSEVDSAHRKIAELERQLRRMRDAAQAQPVKPQASKPSAPGALPQVAEGSLKIAGDPLTGPRRGAAKPKTASAKAAPSKVVPAKSTAKKPTTKGKR